MANHLTHWSVGVASLMLSSLVAWVTIFEGPTNIRTDDRYTYKRSKLVVQN